MSSTAKTPRVIIIGAGPAGLTAALELCRKSDIRPIVLEALEEVGGLSRTVEFRGNRMDIGGHRFFSKSDWVMDWWREILPPAVPPPGTAPVNYVPAEERVMLLRSRLSRIYFLRRFFDYPISLSAQTMKNLGIWRLVKIGISYARANFFPRHPERNLEDFFVNRFGGELYQTFFKDYTEKVWGVPCREISPEWGAQRIKGLSVWRALVHAAKKMMSGNKGGVAQKKTETSLIEKFLYPKYGPGQMWHVVTEQIKQAGGEIRHHAVVCGIEYDAGRIRTVCFRDQRTDEIHTLPCDHVISTMPVKDLFASLQPQPPEAVRSVAEGLMYRDFITVGVLARKLRKSRYTPPDSNCNLLPDNWIYIQEPDVQVGRLQIFNNWSPALVKDPDTVWLGMEYFCQEGNALWQLSDADMGKLAVAELEKISLLDSGDVIDFHVVRVPKAYPAYFGTYDQFGTLRQFTDGIANLFLVGRNGMHRYNNQDHSMVTAKLAVEAILSDSPDKSALWSVNVEEDYHEEKEQRSRPQ